MTNRQIVSITDSNSDPATWYSTWFDSPYYSKLYAHRDDAEAHLFIDVLLGYLKPYADAKILDLACGRGRFSRYLAAKGFAEVVGLDLSVSNIEAARAYEQPNLTFYTHDMRFPYRINYFDYIFNFFTSFGYFDDEKDDLNTLKSIARGLRPNGTFVLDYLNTQYVIDNLTGYEKKEMEGITFHLHKFIRGNQIIKTIDFTDEGKEFHFEERVRLFFLDDFERLFQRSGLQLMEKFGSYQLEPFDMAQSPRLILLTKRL